MGKIYFIIAEQTRFWKLSKCRPIITYVFFVRVGEVDSEYIQLYSKVPWILYFWREKYGRFHSCYENMRMAFHNKYSPLCFSEWPSPNRIFRFYVGGFFNLSTWYKSVLFERVIVTVTSIILCVCHASIKSKYAVAKQRNSCIAYAKIMSSTLSKKKKNVICYIFYSPNNQPVTTFKYTLYTAILALQWTVLKYYNFNCK